MWCFTTICFTQGPEIRTGFLKNPDQPIKLTAGKEISITTDYDVKGDDNLIAMRYSLDAFFARGVEVV